MQQRSAARTGAHARTRANTAACPIRAAILRRPCGLATPLLPSKVHVPAQREQPPSTRFLPAPLKRFREHLREVRRLAGETQAFVSAAHAQSTARLGEISVQLAQLQAQQEAAASIARAEHQQLVRILRFVHDSAQRRRERLHQLRADPGYEAPFSDPVPLISVVIPTYDNYTLLRERSIPSVLAQSYQNFEVVVVGDAAPEEARRVVAAFDDPRITFFNLPYRGPYPDDAQTRWLVSGVPPTNEAVRRARGLWIAPLADDDAFRPHHLARLLERARSDRLELAYSRLSVHFPNGSEAIIGCFPPALGEFGVQAALYHAGLSGIFEYELADAAFGLPEDWALCLRMMEASVRIGMFDEVTVDYYPSRSWTPRWEEDRYGPEPEPIPSSAGNAASGTPGEETPA